MSMQKTLGGDRLGSGKRMKVELHGYERSTHDKGYLWRSTMSSGTLVPFMVEVGLPGDTFDVYLDCDVKTHPTIGPLFGSFKVQLDTFMVPIRLYNAALHNNMLNIGRKMSEIKLPRIRLAAKSSLSVTDPDVANAQINPSALLAYLGIRGIGWNLEATAKTRDFNGTAIIAYYDIVKNYYANKQEEVGYCIANDVNPVTGTVTNMEVVPPTSGAIPIVESPTVVYVEITAAYAFAYSYTFPGASPQPDTVYIQTVEHGPLPVSALFENLVDDGAGEWTGVFNYSKWGNTTFAFYRRREPSDVVNTELKLVSFPLENIDSLRTEILESGKNSVTIDDTSLTPYRYNSNTDLTDKLKSSQQGLAVKTYQSDIFNNWLSTDWIDGVDGITAVTAIDTSTGSFTLDTLNLSQKVYNMLNRIAVSGGTYDDWLDAVYTDNRYMRAETPMYMGGLIKELVFQEVISNAETDGQALGTLAGKGVMGRKHKGGQVHIKCDEPCYIIGIVSLTPRIDYSQGNVWDTGLQTIDDLHKPALDQIGFQELITEQMLWADTLWDETEGVWLQRSAGKQPAWINYMTNYNRTFGNFAIQDNEMFMTLNRRYEYDLANSRIKDLTTYIDPAKYNFIFAETAIDSQNFWTQIAVDMTVRRKMSAKVMPNL